MDLRNVAACGKADARFVLVPRFDIILGKALADLARGAPHDGILVGVVVRLPFENVHTNGPLFQTLKASVQRSLNHVA